jgi:hypothetical protein
MSRAWKVQLEERRRTIEKLERDLAGCIGCGCLSLKACALLNPEDVLGEDGAGPVRLSPEAVAEATARDGVRREAAPYRASAPHGA